MTKLVSVIIPTYNRSKFLSMAIDSCLRQSYRSIEILIIDDHSLDDTAQVIQGYQDPRIKYFVHEKNLGLAAARNTGLRNASGEFIAFLDDDDEWLADKISRQLEVFENNKSGIGLVFTNGYSERVNRLLINEKAPSGIVYDPKNDNFFPLRLLITPPSSWMMLKDVVNKIGYEDENMGNNYEDGEYFTRLALKYPVYFLNENLVTWHALKDHLNIINANQIKNREYFLNKYYESIKKDKQYLFGVYKVLGKDSIAIDKAKSRKYLLKALLIRPWDFTLISKLIRN